MGQKRQSYEASKKVEVVLATMAKDTTIEKVSVKYGISASVINKWRNAFKANAYLAFTAPAKKKKTKPEDSPGYLRKLIGDLTVENAILKKASSVWD